MSVCLGRVVELSGTRRLALGTASREGLLCVLLSRILLHWSPQFLKSQISGSLSLALPPCTSLVSTSSHLRSTSDPDFSLPPPTPGWEKPPTTSWPCAPGPCSSRAALETPLRSHRSSCAEKPQGQLLGKGAPAHIVLPLPQVASEVARGTSGNRWRAWCCPLPSSAVAAVGAWRG